jgi:hypothetical protein
MRRMLVYLGVALILVGISIAVLTSSSFGLYTLWEHDYLPYRLNWTDKLKAGELFYVWTGPEDGQTWDGVYINPDGKYSLRFEFSLWNGSVLHSRWLSPSTNLFDVREMNIRMPSQDVWVVMNLYRCVNPTLDSFGEFVICECLMYTVLDGKITYPIDYENFELYSANVYATGLNSNDLYVMLDIEVKEGTVKLYAVPKLSWQEWYMPKPLDSLAVGRYTRTYAWNTTKYVLLRISGQPSNMYPPISLSNDDFTQVLRDADSINDITDDYESYISESPLKYSVLQWTSYGFIVVGVVCVLIGTIFRKEPIE